jgi:hypothetical protein
MWCLCDNATLEQTINVLKSHEIHRLPTEIATATATHKRKEWKGKDKRREPRSQDSRSRQQQDWSCSHTRSCQRQDRSRSRSRSPSRSPSPSDRLKCYFCRKRGHIQRDCRKYIRARKQVEQDNSSGDDEVKKSKDKSKDKESAHYVNANADAYDCSL